MKFDDKSKKTLLHSKNLEIEVKKKGEGLKKLREISSNLINEKTPSLIINNITNPENFDKIDQMLHINKKKTLKPVEHPILLNNKTVNEKTKEPSDMKLNIKNQKILNTEEAIQQPKIKKVSDNNVNKSISSLMVVESDKTFRNNEVSKDLKENYVKKNYHGNSLDLNSIKNIDLGEARQGNESFFDYEENEDNKESQNNPLMNLSDKNFNSINNVSKSKWNFDKNLLDDSEFRKTHIIKEKLDIEYIREKPNNIININKNRSVKKSDNSMKISSPRKENIEINAIHKKVNSMIFIENKENQTIRDLTNAMNKSSNSNINNLPEAKSNIKVEPQELEKIEKFLGDINLEKHLDTFIDKGYQSLDKIISEITDEKLKDLLIPYGHRIKILKRIKEFKNEPVNKIIGNKQIVIKKEQKPKTNFQYDELPDELEIHNSIMNSSRHSIMSEAKNLDVTKNTIDLNNKDNINNFEEFEKRKFHQAVIDFVNENRPKYDKDGEKIIYLKEEYGKEIKNTIVSVKKEASITTNDIETNKKSDYEVNNSNTQKNVVIEDKTRINSSKSITTNITDLNSNLENRGPNKVSNVVAEKPEMRSTFNDFPDLVSNDPMKNFLPFNQKKESCFNCFKLFLDCQKVSFCGKVFCGVECKKNFEEINMTYCEMENCKKYIYKANSIKDIKKYYCSMKCYENSEDNINSLESLEDKKTKNEVKTANKSDEYVDIDYDPMEDF